MTADGPDRSRLIADARKGDPAALSQLLPLFQNYLRLLARTSMGRSLQPEVDPSELVNETLFKATRQFATFRGTTEAELAAWLRRILSRSLADFVDKLKARRRDIRRQVSLDELLDRSSQAMAQVLAGREHSPSESAARRDVAVVLSDALAALPEDRREVIVLYNLQQLAWPEVAARMGRTVNAVRILWARALKQLRPLIEDRIG